MKQEYSATRDGVSIRPAKEADSQLILDLRNNPKLSQFIGSMNITLDQQRAWMRSYEAREQEYYYIVEAKGRAVGAISIYNYRRTDSGTEAEWGRWVVDPDFPVGPTSALLLFEIAFERLGLDLLFCQTLVGNDSVISFHDMYATRSEDRALTVKIDGIVQPAVFHELKKDRWVEAKTLLGRMSRIAVLTLR